MANIGVVRRPSVPSLLGFLIVVLVDAELVSDLVVDLLKSLAESTILFFEFPPAGAVPLPVAVARDELADDPPRLGKILKAMELEALLLECAHEALDHAIALRLPFRHSLA